MSQFTTMFMKLSKISEKDDQMAQDSMSNKALLP